jgi:hypothetical protein
MSRTLPGKGFRGRYSVWQDGGESKWYDQNVKAGTLRTRPEIQSAVRFFSGSNIGIIRLLSKPTAQVPPLKIAAAL